MFGISFRPRKAHHDRLEVWTSEEVLKVHDLEMGRDTWAVKMLVTRNRIQAPLSLSLFIYLIVSPAGLILSKLGLNFLGLEDPIQPWPIFFLGSLLGPGRARPLQTGLESSDRSLNA